MGRNTAGFNGIRLEDENDLVVGMAIVEPNDPTHTILTISEKGTGKRSAAGDYRLTNRGGKGVKTMEVTDKTGEVIAIKAVAEDEDLMITTKFGIVIRMPVNEIRVMGRATQGVRVIRVDGEDEIADVAVVPHEEEPEIEGLEDVQENGTTEETNNESPSKEEGEN